jgi:hypothetical protein
MLPPAQPASSAPPPSSPSSDSHAKEPPPRWARLVDLLAVALVLVAVVVALSGGFRLRLDGFRVAVTSPYRLALWALGIAILRHLIVRRGPIYRDLPARLARGWKSPAGRTMVGALIGTRAPVLVVGFLSVLLIGYRQGGAPWKVDPHEIVNLQARWDAGWYLGIAVEGYRYLPRRPNDQQNIVFFPAFPLLMRIAGRLLGGSPPAYVLGGTIVVLAAFGIALVYLYRLARDLLGDDGAARQAVWLLAAYPFALYYGALYTESVFLVGAVGACFHFSRREWTRAGAWGLLAGLTRPNGCFLSIPLAVMALSPSLPRWLAGGRPADPSVSAPIVARSWLAAALSAAMPGVGVLLYSAYIWRLTGNPFAWAAGHVAWGRQYEGVGVLFSEHIDYLAQVGLYAYTTQLPYDVLNGGGAIFVLAAALPVARRLGLAYAVFILVNMLPPLAAGGFMSGGRISSVIFPVFCWLAGAVAVHHRSAWVASFMALQAFNAALFYTWRPMF